MKLKTEWSIQWRILPKDFLKIWKLSILSEKGTRGKGIVITFLARNHHCVTSRTNQRKANLVKVCEFFSFKTPAPLPYSSKCCIPAKRLRDAGCSYIGQTKQHFNDLLARVNEPRGPQSETKTHMYIAQIPPLP